jgi:putative nucleotidyltransferase with HDIG domain
MLHTTGQFDSAGCDSAVCRLSEVCVYASLTRHGHEQEFLLNKIHEGKKDYVWLCKNARSGLVCRGALRGNRSGWSIISMPLRQESENPGPSHARRPAMTQQEGKACVEQADSQSVPAAMIPISLATFRKSMLDCDIYIRQGANQALALYRKKSQTLDSAALDRLAERGIKELHVSFRDQEANRQRVAREISQDTTRPPSERYNILREVNRASFDVAYHCGDVEQVVDVVNDMGTQLSGVLNDNDIVLTELLSLMDHDDDTYSHSVNVATYTMLLAKYLGIGHEAHLCVIMIGGLFHDLGKRHVHVDVLNKKGKLDAGERRQIEQHPVTGFKDLLPRGELTWEQLMIVYQHHEHYGGGGYPLGLPGSEINDLARVTTVADVFHALTSVRPYRKPMPTSQACDFLASKSGKMFDPEIARCWISKMKATACA